MAGTEKRVSVCGSGGPLTDGTKYYKTTDLELFMGRLSQTVIISHKAFTWRLLGYCYTFAISLIGGVEGAGSADMRLLKVDPQDIQDRKKWRAIGQHKKNPVRLKQY